MRKIIFKDSFLNEISVNDHKILLATIRIYSVLSMKYKVVVDTFLMKNLNNGEFIDLYSDLLATFHEGAKNFFKNYNSKLLSLSNKTECSYSLKMVKIFQPDNKDVDITYKILREIRNGYSFHFGIKTLTPIHGAPIGVMGDNNEVVFTSITPNLFRDISKEIGIEMSKESIQNFFRKTLNKEVKPFIEYLEEIIHSIVDNNIDLID